MDTSSLRGNLSTGEIFTIPTSKGMLTLRFWSDVSVVST